MKLPEPPMLRLDPTAPAQPPAGLGSKELAQWHLAQIREHEAIRARSFYDTGKHIEALLAMRQVIGAKDIKELCSKVDLGMSHMTANKYLQVARTFDRDTAVQQGIEKCYALTLYAKAIGREGQARKVLAEDRRVPELGGERVSKVSASKLYEAVRALKEAAKEGRQPSEIQAARARTAQAAEKLARRIGFRGAQAEIVRRDGHPRLAIYVSLEVAEELETRVPAALPKYARALAKKQPDLFEPLRAAGWKLR